MTIVVEDGTGKPDANAFVSVAEVDAYHASRGDRVWGPSSEEDKEFAIVRATAFVHNNYRDLFSGYETYGRRQSLSWPRVGAYADPPSDYADNSTVFGQTGYYFNYLANYLIRADEVPREVKYAVAEAALIELGSPGSLVSGTNTAGGAIKEIKAGSVQLKYTEGVVSTSNALAGVDLALRSLVGRPHELAGRATRR